MCRYIDVGQVEICCVDGTALVLYGSGHRRGCKTYILLSPGVSIQRISGTPLSCGRQYDVHVSHQHCGTVEQPGTPCRYSGQHRPAPFPTQYVASLHHLCSAQTEDAVVVIFSTALKLEGATCARSILGTEQLQRKPPQPRHRETATLSGREATGLLGSEAGESSRWSRSELSTAIRRASRVE